MPPKPQATKPKTVSGVAMKNADHPKKAKERREQVAKKQAERKIQEAGPGPALSANTTIRSTLGSAGKKRGAKTPEPEPAVAKQPRKVTPSELAAANNRLSQNVPRKTALLNETKEAKQKMAAEAAKANAVDYGKKRLTTCESTRVNNLSKPLDRKQKLREEDELAEKAKALEAAKKNAVDYGKKRLIACESTRVNNLSKPLDRKQKLREEEELAEKAKAAEAAKRNAADYKKKRPTTCNSDRVNNLCKPIERNVTRKVEEQKREAEAKKPKIDYSKKALTQHTSAAANKLSEPKRVTQPYQSKRVVAPFNARQNMSKSPLSPRKTNCIMKAKTVRRSPRKHPGSPTKDDLREMVLIARRSSSTRMD